LKGAVLCRFAQEAENGFIRLVVDDNTKPFVRMGRKAYRVLLRQPGCRNITRY
jgi:hypothetical protein